MVDNQPLVFSHHKAVIYSWEYWNKVLVAGCPSWHQPAWNREDMLESGKFFSSSWILPPYPILIRNSSYMFGLFPRKVKDRIQRRYWRLSDWTNRTSPSSPDTTNTWACKPTAKLPAVRMPSQAGNSGSLYFKRFVVLFWVLFTSGDRYTTIVAVLLSLMWVPVI